jgi:hypothetical protein
MHYVQCAAVCMYRAMHITQLKVNKCLINLESNIDNYGPLPTANCILVLYSTDIDVA